MPPSNAKYMGAWLKEALSHCRPPRRFAATILSPTQGLSDPSAWILREASFEAVEFSTLNVIQLSAARVAHRQHPNGEAEQRNCAVLEQ